MKRNARLKEPQRDQDPVQLLSAEGIHESKIFSPPPLQLFASDGFESEEDGDAPLMMEEESMDSFDTPEDPAENGGGDLPEDPGVAGSTDDDGDNDAIQMKKESAPGEGQAVKANHTGLPDQLKSNMESMSGVDLSDVKVHYNSSEPMQLQAHAYAQGTDIHVAPGQEQHLGHEAWHVVQQKQGRVKPTKQLKKDSGQESTPLQRVSINDDPQLEKEADEMGAKAQSGNQGEGPVQLQQGQSLSSQKTIQRVVKPEDDVLDENDKKSLDYIESPSTNHISDFVLLRILEQANQKIRDSLKKEKIKGLKKEINEKKDEKFEAKNKGDLVALGNIHSMISQKGKVNKEKGKNSFKFNEKKQELPNLVSLIYGGKGTGLQMQTPHNLFGLSGGNYKTPYNKLKEKDDLDVPMNSSETSRSSLLNNNFNSMNNKVMEKEDMELDKEHKEKLDLWKEKNKDKEKKSKKPQRKKGISNKNIFDHHPMGGNDGQKSGFLNDPIMGLDEVLKKNPKSYNSEYKKKHKKKKLKKRKSMESESELILPESKRRRLIRGKSEPLLPKDQKTGHYSKKRHDNVRKKYEKYFPKDESMDKFINESSRFEFKEEDKKSKMRRKSEASIPKKKEWEEKGQMRQSMKHTFDNWGLKGSFSPEYEYDDELEDYTDVNEEIFNGMDPFMKGTTLAFLHPDMKESHQNVLDSQSVDKTSVKLSEEQRLLHYIYGLYDTQKDTSKYDTNRLLLNSNTLYTQYRNNKKEEDYSTPYNPNFGSYEKPFDKLDNSKKKDQSKIKDKMKSVVNPKVKSDMNNPGLEQMSGTMHIAESTRNPHMVPLNPIFFDWALGDGSDKFMKDLKGEKNPKKKDEDDDQNDFFKRLVPDYAPMSFGLSQDAARQIREKLKEYDPDKIGGKSMEALLKELYQEKGKEWEETDSKLRTPESRGTSKLGKSWAVLELMLREVVLLRGWLNSLLPRIKPKDNKYTESLIEHLVAGLAFEYYDVEEEVLAQRLSDYDGTLELVQIPKDGNCLYHSVVHQLSLVEVNTTVKELRGRLVILLNNNSVALTPFMAGRNANEVANDILENRSWNNQGGDIAGQLLATVIGQTIHVVTPNGVEDRTVNNELETNDAQIDGVNNPIVIAYNGYGHYWSTQEVDDEL